MLQSILNSAAADVPLFNLEKSIIQNFENGLICSFISHLSKKLHCCMLI